MNSRNPRPHAKSGPTTRNDTTLEQSARHDTHRTDNSTLNPSPLQQTWGDSEMDVIGLMETEYHLRKARELLDEDESTGSQIMHSLSHEAISNIIQFFESYKASHGDVKMDSSESVLSASPPNKPSDMHATSATSKNTTLEYSLMYTSKLNLDLRDEMVSLRVEINTLRRQLGEKPMAPLEGLNEAIHAPIPHGKVTKSANPIPIRPVTPIRKNAPQHHTSQTPHRKPTSPTQRHHESRLIIHYTPKIDTRTLGQPGRIVEEINRALHSLSPPAPAHIGVKGMMTSVSSGTPIIIAADGCTASSLEAYSETISRIVAGEAHFDTAEAKADRQRFEVCLENVPLRSYLGVETQPNIIESIIAETSGLRDDLQLATKPRFMISDGDREFKSRAPVRLSFLDNEQARKVLLAKTYFFDGTPCTARPYIERLPLIYCRLCSSIGHRENSRGCKGPCCEICTSGNHDTSSHQPSDPPPKCINCAGPHPSRARECPARKQSTGNLNTTAEGRNPRSHPKPALKSKNARKGTKDADGYTQTPTTRNHIPHKHNNTSPYMINLERLGRDAIPDPQEQPDGAPGTPIVTQSQSREKEDSQMSEF